MFRRQWESFPFVILVLLMWEAKILLKNTSIKKRKDNFCSHTTLKSYKYLVYPFNDQCSHHVEISQLICSAENKKYILLNNLGSKDGLLIKFGQLMSYSKRNNIIKKFYKKCGLKTSSRLFCVCKELTTASIGK